MAASSLQLHQGAPRQIQPGGGGSVSCEVWQQQKVVGKNIVSVRGLFPLSHLVLQLQSWLSEEQGGS